jgi:hypothetical protein
MRNDKTSVKENLREHTTRMLQEQVHKLNEAFTKMPVRSQSMILLSIGLLTATICALSISEGFSPRKPTTIAIDSITHPLMQPMEKKQDTTALIPLGKMKGEINGQFTAFYVAMDGKGNFFRNENPTYAKDRWIKSDNWKHLSYQEFMNYEKQLYFLPIEGKAKSLKR